VDGNVPNNSKKVIYWWNQEVKDDIQAKKVACKAWLQKKKIFLHICGMLRREPLQPVA